jgi:hypothetical protein
MRPPGHEAGPTEKETKAMTANAAVVDLLTDMDPENGPFVHMDGRPFTEAETQTVMGATADDLNAASRRAEAAAAEAEQGARLFRAAGQLINSTPGATTLNDAARIRGRDLDVLLAEESGMSLEEVREVISRGDPRP